MDWEKIPCRHCGMRFENLHDRDEHERCHVASTARVKTDDKSHERHRLYMEANPEKRCWQCAKDLNRHTVAEFQHCEFLLATSGEETMVMNRPDTRVEPLKRKGVSGA